jgi:predicted MFS family arabinose efflux permease
MNPLSRRHAVVVFCVFAFAYFFSAVLRAITATLSPVLTQEFALHARDLGLLAGGYFLGFAVMQLPLGRWLDRHGPRTVLLCFLGIAVFGCILFAVATGFTGLMIARLLCGAGVGACLMAPLTAYRRWLSASAQLRANSWMLMVASLGTVASTLPVQWFLRELGWRPIFWGLSGCLLTAMALIAWKVPAWNARTEIAAAAPTAAGNGYAQIWRHAYFRQLTPLGFFNYGGMLAIQTLWAGPWMVRVAGYTPLQSAAGLFLISLSMLVTFWLWGLLNPVLARKGLGPDRLIAWGLPLSLGTLAAIIVAGPSAGAAAWAAFCVTSTFVSLAQPAVGLAFPSAQAGRALSAYNLVIFSGVFTVQWGIGLLVDGFGAAGLNAVNAFQAAMTVFLTCCAASYGYFVLAKSHNARQQPSP